MDSTEETTTTIVVVTTLTRIAEDVRRGAARGLVAQRIDNLVTFVVAAAVSE